MGARYPLSAEIRVLCGLTPTAARPNLRKDGDVTAMAALASAVCETTDSISQGHREGGSMAANPYRTHRLSGEPPAVNTPLLPTVVFASYKGGVWKTGLSVATAERLALAGLKVLLITADRQEDARARLGVKPSENLLARRDFGQGSVSVLGIRGPHVAELLYRSGPERLGHGSFDVAVVDTPPEQQGGSLPGVLLMAIIDGVDAAKNLVMMLRDTPANTEVMLVKVQGGDPDEWARNAWAIGQAVGRQLDYVDTPLPRVDAIKAAHDDRKSVWTLSRRGKVLEFVSIVDSMAKLVWERTGRTYAWPALPSTGASAPHIRFWDDDAP